jgi:hypothetical protein
MSMAHDNAVDALKALLWELPAEFSRENPSDMPIDERREEFYVVGRHNIGKVHFALWELQEYFGLTED